MQPNNLFTLHRLNIQLHAMLVNQLLVFLVNDNCQFVNQRLQIGDLLGNFKQSLNY